MGALSPAASGRGLSQGQPSALGPRVAPPVLRTLAVPSLLGVCLLRLGGGGTECPPERGGAEGSREAPCATLAFQTRPRGRPGPSNVCVPRTDGLWAGTTWPAPPCCCVTDAYLCNRGSHTAPPAHRAVPLEGECGGGGRSAQTRAPGSRHGRSAGQPLHPAGASWSTWPQPCAPSRDGGLPCLDGPCPEEQRDRDDCFIFIRKATKKKRTLRRCDPGRA